MEEDKTNPQFAESGYNSTSIVKNLGIVGLIAIVAVVFVGFILVFAKLLNRCKCGH